MSDEDGTERRDHLVYDGICPVCGDEFIDGYDKLEEGESYNARICVDEIGGENEGKMLVHLEDLEDEDGSDTATDGGQGRDPANVEHPEVFPYR